MAKLSFPVRFFFVILLSASVIVPSSFTVTWQREEHRLTENTSFDGLPTITEMDDSKIWIVWARSILGNLTLFYKTSSDLGITWSDEKNITEMDLGQNTSPSIVQLINGTIMVVWSSSRAPMPPTEPDFTVDASPQSLTVEKGHSGNSTIIITSLMNFSEPVNLSVKKVNPSIHTTFDQNPVTPPPNGTVDSTLTISVDLTVSPGNYILTVLGKSESKSHSVNVFLEVTEVGGSANNNTSLSSSSVSLSETLEDYEIYYKISNDNGATWSNDVQLTDNTGDDLSPSIVQLTNGTIMLVWQSDRTGNPDIFYKTSNGTSWSDAIQLTTNFALDMGPSVVKARDGRIWATWASYRTGDFEIFYKTYDGSSWSSDRRLTFSDTTSDAAPSILQALDETIWVFWSSHELKQAATGDIYYKCSKDNGVTWEDSMQFTIHNGEDIWPSAAQTSDTKIWVVWTSDRADQPGGNWDIYYKYSDEMVIHDVAITHVEPATSTAKLGDLITITVMAENQGTKEEGFEVNCYANSTSTESKQVTSLNAGDAIELYFTWNTTSFAAGVYVISATASGLEDEVDTEDNTFTDGTVELMEPIHDVAVIDVTLVSNLVHQGDTTSVDVTTQNQGTEIETFDVGCYVNSTSIGSQTLTLNPADSILLTFTWDTSGYAIGNYVVSATADTVPDEDYMDDNVFIDGTIELVAQPVHDVAVIDVTPSATNVLVGQSVSIEVTVRNEGTETETFDVTAKYDDTDIGAQTVTSLAAGDVKTETFTWDTSDVSAGSYTIKATASTILGETDTADNTFIDGEVSVGRHDVAITNIVVNTTTVLKGDTISIDVTVANLGDFPETFNVTVYANETALGTKQVTSLDNAADIVVSFVWDTTDFAVSEYTIRAEASTVPHEVDTENNVMVYDKQVAVQIHDVAITSVTMYYKQVIAGVPVSIYVIVENEGTFSENFDAAVYYSNATFEDTAAPLQTVNLAVKEIKTLEFIWDTANISLGMYTIKANATAVEDEADITDNVMIGGVIKIGEVNIVKYSVTVGGLTFHVVTESNSTISNVNLSLADKKISLNVTGPDDSIGFCNVTIPHTLLGGPYTLLVNDSNPSTRDETTNGTHTFLHFTYSHSTAEVEIIGTTVATPPVAAFTYSPGYPLERQIVTFNASESYDPDADVQPGVVSYEWDFENDGTWDYISTDPITTHAYMKYGIYTVALKAIDNEGFAGKDSKSITVKSLPIATFAFSPESPLVGETVTFNATESYDPDGTIDSYEWAFGDSTSGIYVSEKLTAIVTHTYTMYGTYTVTLAVTDNDNLSNSTTQEITILAPPVAIFTYSPENPVKDELITFNATQSTPNGGVISQYTWDFGDGVTGWGMILDYSYASLKTCNVTLTVTDSEGLTDSTIRTVTVHAAPVASFIYTPNAPKVGELVTFNASTSYNPEGSAIVSFTWDFGDGVNGTGMIKTHTYTNSGTYVATLAVKDMVGNEDTDSMTITVAEAPLPFSPWTLKILGVVIAVVAMGLVLTVLFFRKRTAGTKS